MRTEAQVRKMLARFKQLERAYGGRMIEEMHGEVYALEYVLEERDDLL